MFLTLGIIQEHYDTKMRLELGISLRSSGFPPFAVAGVLLAAAVVLALGASFGTRTFWLPRERLSFNGEAPFTGYVLKASDDQLTILHDRPRIIIEKPKAALQDRDFCYPEDHKARSSKVAADSPVCP